MTTYERRCRSLLVAFPPDFRAARGDDLVTTMIDAAPPGARRMPLRTLVDVIAAGLRMRAAHAGARGRKAVTGGVVMSATAAVGLQAAVAAASAAFFVEHGVVFYLNAGGDRASVVGGQHPAIWIAVALVCAAALVASVLGKRWIAAACTLAGAAYPLVVAGVLVHAVQRGTLGMLSAPVASPATPGVTGFAPATAVPARGLPGGAFSFRYQNFVSTPAFLAIGVIAAIAAVAAARHRPPTPRSTRAGVSAWLVGFAGLAVLLTAVGDGSGASGSWPNLSYSIPPQGGIMTAFQYLWLVAIVIGIAWTAFDARAGWATTLLTLPFLAYQISSLTIGKLYYGELYQPRWRTDLPLIAASLAIITLAATATRTARSLTRR